MKIQQMNAEALSKVLDCVEKKSPLTKAAIVRACAEMTLCSPKSSGFEKTLVACAKTQRLEFNRWPQIARVMDIPTVLATSQPTTATTALTPPAAPPPPPQPPMFGKMAWAAVEISQSGSGKVCFAAGGSAPITAEGISSLASVCDLTEFRL